MAPKIRASLLFLGTLSLAAACGPGDSKPAEGPGKYAGGLDGPAAPGRTPDQLIEEAVGFLELNNGPRARDLLLQALAQDEDNAEAQHLLGRTLMGLARVDVAHDGSPGSVGLSRDKEVQEQGVQALRRATELAPGDADYFYWLGRALHRSEDNQGAVIALNQATELEPLHGMAHKRLGITHLDAGEPELALQSFLVAEKLLPKDPGPAFQVGNLLLEEDPAGARDAFRRSIAADISFPASYNGLIAVLNRLGDTTGSAQAAADFAKWNEFEIQLQGLMGRAQNRAGDVDAQLDVADALMTKQDWEGARDYFVRTILLDAGNDYAHYHLGILNHRLGEDSTALVHLEETIHLKPSALEPRLLLLQVCKNLGNQERLTQLLAELQASAAGLDPEARLRIASTLHEAGMEAEAETQYRALLEAHPDFVPAQDGLQILLGGAESE